MPKLFGNANKRHRSYLALFVDFIWILHFQNKIEKIKDAQMHLKKLDGFGT